MMSSARKNVVVVLVVILVIVNGAIVFFRHQRQIPELAQVREVELKSVAPELSDKLDGQVARLERESLTESLAKLSDVNMFYWPGPSLSEGRLVETEYVPLGEDVGRSDLEAIMSNRRFRKIFEELSEMDKAAASQMVNRELPDAIAKYLKLYDTDMRRFAPQYKLEKTAGLKAYDGPGIEIANVPEGKVVIAGVRLKVLALVWTCGMLGLTSSKDQVERVARMAVKQRADLYDDPTLDPFFKSQMLEMLSLYNRQIVSSGLLGVTVKGDREESIMKAARVEWRERQLTSYRSQLTEFDLPVKTGVMRPDYSLGSQTVKFTSPLNDRSFDILLRRLHLIP